jgi:hypothetical protein
MLAAHFDSWIFVLFVAMAALLRLLSSKAGSSGKQSDVEENQAPPPPPENTRPVPRAATSDEEQIRKFLEALGQPTTSPPPAPVTPRHDLPPRPVAPVRPPSPMFPTRTGIPKPAREGERPVVTPEKTVARRRTVVPAIPPPVPMETQERRVVAAAPPVILQPLTEAYAIATPSPSATDTLKTDVRTLLTSPAGLRNAIILREIFGPPRSLQPLEDLAGTA